MGPVQKFVPIYSTRGDVKAFLVYPYIYNRNGDWIGWINRNHHVYSVHGNYVGWLSDDPRILRKESTAQFKPRLTPPPPPVKVNLPDVSPLPKMLSDLKIGTFDVLEVAPELLPPDASTDADQDGID